MRPIILQIFNLGFARLIATIANILIFVLAARYLDQADYGRLRQFFVPYDLFSPIITMGIPAGILYIIGKSTASRGLLSRSVGIIAATCSFYTIVFTLAGPAYLSAYLISGSLTFSIALLGLYAFTQSLQQVVQPFAIQLDRSSMLAANTLLSSLALTVVTWLVLRAGMAAEHLVLVRSTILLLAALQIMAVIAVAPARNTLRRADDAGAAPQTFKTIIHYCFPLGIASGINAVSLGIDKLIVSLGTDERTYAIYANGAMELPLIGVLVGSISTVILSEMVRRIEVGDKHKALALFRVSGNIAALLIFPLFFVAFFYADTLMTVLFSSKYVESAAIFRTYLLVLPVRIVVFGAAIIALGKGMSILVRGLIELALNAILGIGLFYLWGPYAVPLSFVLTTYLWSVPYNLRLIAQGFGARYSAILDAHFLGRIALLCALLSPLLMIPTMLNMQTLVADGVCTTLYLAIVALVYVRMGLVQNFGNLFAKKHVPDVGLD